MNSKRRLKSFYHLGPSNVNGLPMAPLPTKTERLAIIVEWGNISPTCLPHSVSILNALRREILAYRTENTAVEIVMPIEVILVYDEHETFSENLEEHLRIFNDVSTDILIVRPVPVCTSAYYVLKNIGYQHSQGTINIFVDSDMIPDPGWLEQLIAPFSSSKVQVVSGNTYIEPTGFIGKAFALCWFHPKREVGTYPTEPARQFFANNFALRLSAHREPLFSRLPGDIRGSCMILAADMSHRGIKILHSPGAGACHPAPSGVAGIILRALIHGRDLVILSRSLRHFEKSVEASGTHFKRLLMKVLGVPASVIRRSRTVGISALELPVVVVICSTYFVALAISAIMTSINTSLMLRILPKQPRSDA
jgi:hypothetical protein